MFRNPTTDLIVVLVIVLLIFGPKRLPGLGRQLGQGLREFKDSITGDSKDSESERPALESAPQAAPGADVTGQSGPPTAAAQSGQAAQTEHAAQSPHQSAEVGSERSS
ncbi:MAG: twin-arginine translocase TatA/TatE family subunit [Solirubrobacterales bacterium]|nr:twin-arginine translocase TatA/TatE family subunit [Solirubrobacterales bacterium]